MQKLAMADLSDTLVSDEARFGGKAAGLGRLIAARARVPGGFAVEATASLPETWSAVDRTEFVRRVRSLTGSGPIAIRSSALGEDSAAHSFAGQFSTVLDVTGVEQAFDAASRCIASGRGRLVEAYRQATDPHLARTAALAGLPMGRAGLPVGLVCQSMVPASAAGVCFTRDPLGRDGAVVVEAVAGCGEALVSGHREPERWRAYRTGFGSWVARRDEAGARGSAPVLSSAQVVAIASEAAGLAARRGAALDLEWAIDAGGHAWWLQARPVTAAEPIRTPEITRGAQGDEGPVTVWSNFNLGETMPEPISPLAWSAWRDVVPYIMGKMSYHRPPAGDRHLRILDLVEGRPCWNLNACVTLLGKRGLQRWMTLFDESAGETVRALLDSGTIAPRAMNPHWLAYLPAWLRQQVRLAGPVLASWKPGRAMKLLEAVGERAAAQGRRDLSRHSDEQLLDLSIAATICEPETIMIGASGALLGVVAFCAARRLFAGFPRACELLAVGYAGTPTTQISVGLDELVTAARPFAADLLDGGEHAAIRERLSAHAAGRAWLASLDAFLDRFGHRCPREFDIATPRWSDDPSMIIELVRAGLRLPPGEAVMDRLLRLDRERREAIEAAVAASRWWRRPLMRAAAAVAHAFLPLREAAKHHALSGGLAARRIVRQLGERFARRGALRTQDDVFLLELHELRALAADPAHAGPGLAELEARRDHMCELAAHPVPGVLRSDGVPVETPCPARPLAPGTLGGTPVSGGTATGTVRVLTSPDPEALRPGDVLVVRVADPGWTPLFPMASAIVMEVGGLMCHAAVVARELGIPAVFGVKGATTTLTNRQVVTVDGRAGLVRAQGPS